MAGDLIFLTKPKKKTQIIKFIQSTKLQMGLYHGDLSYFPFNKKDDVSNGYQHLYMCHITYIGRCKMKIVYWLHQLFPPFDASCSSDFHYTYIKTYHNYSKIWKPLSDEDFLGEELKNPFIYARILQHPHRFSKSNLVQGSVIDATEDVPNMNIPILLHWTILPIYSLPIDDFSRKTVRTLL